MENLGRGGRLVRVKPIFLQEHSGEQFPRERGGSSGEDKAPRKAAGRKGEIPREGKAQEGMCFQTEINVGLEKNSTCREQNPEVGQIEGNTASRSFLWKR